MTIRSLLAASLLALAAGPAAQAALVTSTSTGDNNPDGSEYTTDPVQISSSDLLQAAGVTVSSTSDAVVFTYSDGNTPVGGGIPVVTDGAFGTAPAGVAIVGNDGRGANLTYNLNLATSPAGYDLSSIAIWGGWGDNGRDGVTAKIAYATAANPGVFVDLATVNYNGDGGFPQSYNRVLLTDDAGNIASGVTAIRFTFNLPNVENNWVGIREIDVLGVATIPEPASLALVALGGLAMLRRKR